MHHTQQHLGTPTRTQVRSCQGLHYHQQWSLLPPPQQKQLQLQPQVRVLSRLAGPHGPQASEQLQTPTGCQESTPQGRAT